MRTILSITNRISRLSWAFLAFLSDRPCASWHCPGYMSDIINNGIVKGDMDYIWKIGMIMILVSCGSVVCSIVSSYLSARTAAGSARRIRGALFDKVTDFSAAELSEFSTASLITRSTNDVQMVQQTTVMTLRLACFAPIMGIGAGPQGTADQRFPFLDGRSGAGCDRCDHADAPSFWFCRSLKFCRKNWIGST